MPRLSVSAGTRSVPTSTLDSSDAPLLQRKRFRQLRGLGPFYFCQTVQKLGKFHRRNSRLCLINDSLLLGANSSSGELSFCIRIEDVALLITDSCYLAVGVRVRDMPFGTKKGRYTFADMPVDVLLFAPNAAVLNEFLDAFGRVYAKRTGLPSVPVRERMPGESFAASLTLLPEGRRVRLPASTTLEKLPPLPFSFPWTGSESPSPVRSRNPSNVYDPFTDTEASHSCRECGSPASPAAPALPNLSCSWNGPHRRTSSQTVVSFAPEPGAAGATSVACAVNPSGQNGRYPDLGKG